MKKVTTILFASIIASLFMVSCAPKVMVQTRYASNDKTVKMLTRKEGKTFSRFLQVCSLDSSGSETNCKETLIIDNVNNAISFR